MKTKPKHPTTEFFMFTTTTDAGDKHTVDGDTTYWTDAADADENAQGCGGVVLRVHVSVLSVAVEKPLDYRKPRAAGYVVLDGDDRIVAHGEEKADAIVVYNKLHRDVPFGVGEESVWPATSRLLSAYFSAGSKVAWDADSAADGILDLKD